MTRSEAVRIGIAAMAAWHRADHGNRCVCVEGEQFGRQVSAVVDALLGEDDRVVIEGD